MINKVILLGNLGKDPDTRFTATGKAVTRFSLATSNTWVNGNGEKQQATEWHSVVVWGKQGEACGQFLEKGRQVYVEGALRHRSFDNKEGKEQHVTEIVAQKASSPSPPAFATNTRRPSRFSRALVNRSTAPTRTCTENVSPSATTMSASVAPHCLAHVSTSAANWS